MKRFAVILGALFLVAVSFAAGAWWTHRPAVPATQEQAILYYACPMHPQYRSDRAGDCPSCGMRLEPVSEDRDARPAAGADGAGLPPGAVQVSPERQQTIGVRLGVVERVAGTRTLRTTGRVAPNENAVYPLVAGADGLVREVRGATTGSLVKRNEILLSFYAPEFLTAQQSYFSGLDTIGRVSNDQLQGYDRVRVADGVERFANTLRALGVSEWQLEQMRTSRKTAQYIYIVSPVDGFVLQRNASTGLRVDQGFEFYRIADLRRVWILADVYENQLPFIRSGAGVRLVSAQQNRRFIAAVSDAQPVFDEATRTLKVRLEADNPGFALKPGMFVDVEFDVDLPPSLAVPADAIVDTGLRKTLFVDRGQGFFEPRQVETGWRIGDQVEVIKGLMAGERIVISGTFLIDSESRMRAAAQGIFGAAAEDPVCGMQVDEKRAAAAERRAEYRGKAYFFCADDCRRRFEENPARYARDGGAPTKTGATDQDVRLKPDPATVSAATARDPVCGMDVDVKDATAAGRKVVHEGRAFYFCADNCKRQFDAEPAKYVKAGRTD